MDWKPFLATFGLLFLAELGDKTQVAVILQAAKFQNPWMVFLGASLALVLISGVAVGVGHLMGEFLPAEAIRYGAGALFIIMGVLIMLKIF